MEEEIMPSVAMPTQEAPADVSENIINEQPIAQEQAVAQTVEYAGFWVRFAALLVDGLVLLIPQAVVGAIFGKPWGNILGYVLLWSYAIYMLNTRQATLGKMAVGLKVTTISGDKPTLGKLALREIVGKFVNVLTLSIGYIMIAFTDKKQGLHDMIADTVVVYDPTRKRRGWLVALGIIVALIVPIGIALTIILVSLSSAKNKATDAAVKAQQQAQKAQIESQMQK